MSDSKKTVLKEVAVVIRGNDLRIMLLKKLRKAARTPSNRHMFTEICEQFGGLSLKDLEHLSEYDVRFEDVMVTTRIVRFDEGISF